MKQMKGFTLVEMILVLTLLSILSVIALARWPGDLITLDSQTAQLQTDIRFAQSLAMQRNQRVRINFSTDHYYLSDISGTIPLTHPATNDSNIFLSSGVNLASSYPFIIFNSKGVPYNDSDLPGTPLFEDMTITLTAPDGTTRQLFISPETGKVTHG